MSTTTTTATIPFTVDNTTGNQYYRVRYRQSGTTVWNAISVTGTTASISGLDINILYDFQVVNINGGENPASAVVQSISLTDPSPAFYPTNTSLGIEFDNLSADIDSYTATIAEYSSPGTILHTEIITPASTMDYTFTGLSPLTEYVITITPAANQFYKTYSYNATTLAYATCVGPLTVTATLS